jgi:hypothetical protein
MLPAQPPINPTRTGLLRSGSLRSPPPATVGQIRGVPPATVPKRGHESGPQVPPTGGRLCGEFRTPANLGGSSNSGPQVPPTGGRLCGEFRAPANLGGGSNSGLQVLPIVGRLSREFRSPAVLGGGSEGGPHMPAFVGQVTSWPQVPPTVGPMGGPPNSKRDDVSSPRMLPSIGLTGASFLSAAVQWGGDNSRPPLPQTVGLTRGSQPAAFPRGCNLNGPQVPPTVCLTGGFRFPPIVEKTEASGPQTLASRMGLPGDLILGGLDMRGPKMQPTVRLAGGSCPAAVQGGGNESGPHVSLGVGLVGGVRPPPVLGESDKSLPQTSQMVSPAWRSSRKKRKESTHSNEQERPCHFAEGEGVPAEVFRNIGANNA